MLRSLFLLMALIGTVPLIFVKPHVGILLWDWISYMNPHRLSWGFISSLPMLNVVAGATIVAWAISREPKSFPSHPVTLLLIAYLGWTLVTTLFSLAPYRSWPMLDLFSKVILFTVMTMTLITTPNRLRALLFVTVLSIGFFGVKGGMFTLLSGGGFHVTGAPGTSIGDNNHLALALLMLIPLLRYITLHEPNRLVRLAAFGAMGLLAVSILGSQSRGALVAAVITLPFLAGNARQRIAIFGFITLFSILAIVFMPQSWRDRMATIAEYQEDASAQGRLTMWGGGFRLALERPLVGGGFDSNYVASAMGRHVPPDTTLRAYHSTYFMALGEHGFVGLWLFLSILTASFFTGSKIVALARGRPELSWAYDLAKMCQVSLIAYGVGGAFLSVNKFDLLYGVCAILVITHRILVQTRSPISDPSQRVFPHAV